MKTTTTLVPRPLSLKRQTNIPSNKNNKRMRKAKQKKKKTRSSFSLSRRSPLVQTVCGLSNPFCKHATNSKIMDNSSVRTTSFSLHGRTAISSNAAGQEAILVALQYGRRPYCGPGSGVFPSPTSWTDFPISVPIANVAQFRITSAGFILRNVCAPLTSSGMVHVRIYGSNYGESLGTINLLDYNVTESLDIPLQDCKEVAITVPRQTTFGPQFFFDTANEAPNIIDWSSTGFAPFTVYIDGVPASTLVLSVEYFIHYELVFDDSTGLAQTSSAPPRPIPRIQDAVQSTNNQLPNIFAKGVDRLTYMIEDLAISTLSRSAAPLLALM